MPDTRGDLAVQTGLNLLIKPLPAMDIHQRRLKSWGHKANAGADNRRLTFTSEGFSAPLSILLPSLTAPALLPPHRERGLSPVKWFVSG